MPFSTGNLRKPKEQSKYQKFNNDMFKLKRKK